MKGGVMVMGYHVHVYKLAGLCEIDVDEDKPSSAMKLALDRAKSCNSPEWREPDSNYLAIPFDVGNQSVGCTTTGGRDMELDTAEMRVQQVVTEMEEAADFMRSERADLDSLKVAVALDGWADRLKHVK